MMASCFERHADKIVGVISCFDRIVIQGTLPDICHPGAITNFFNGHGIKIFDFKQWAAPMRDEINLLALWGVFGYGECDQRGGDTVGV